MQECLTIFWCVKKVYEYCWYCKPWSKLFVIVVFLFAVHLPKIKVILRNINLMFVPLRTYSMLPDIVRKWGRSIPTYVPRMDTSALCCRSWELGHPEIVAEVWWHFDSEGWLWGYTQTHGASLWTSSLCWILGSVSEFSVIQWIQAPLRLLQN